MVPAFKNTKRAATAWILLVACLLLVPTRTQSQSASEYQVKAAYLYNFAKLAEWPPDSFSTPSSPIVFCVFGGDEEFVATLRTTVGNKWIGGRSLAVRAVTSGNETDSCTLLFFRASEKARIASVIAGMARPSTLLVGEDSSFLSNGGMINLLLKDGKVRFQVNSLALDQANIGFDASFLSMAISDAGSTKVQNSGSRNVRSNPPPEYPELARKMNITGSVQLQVIVSAEGSVKDVRVLGGHPVLAQAAVQAVRAWKYHPGTAESVETVRLTFGE